MFDAMVDAAYYSMQALNFSGIPVLVTETGWPWVDGVTKPEANVDNALAHNSNLIAKVLNESGTPGRPKEAASAYIYEMFGDWGLFFTNGTPVYSVSFSDSVEPRSNMTGEVGMFCVANSSMGSKALKTGLDWACGPGAANCTAIQLGQPCYEKDIASRASYAYNDYYHRARSSGGSCNFGGTAFITTKDPSHGHAFSQGSSKLNGSTDTSPITAAGSASARSDGVLMLKTPTNGYLMTTLTLLLWFTM